MYVARRRYDLYGQRCIGLFMEQAALGKLVFRSARACPLNKSLSVINLATGMERHVGARRHCKIHVLTPEPERTSGGLRMEPGMWRRLEIRQGVSRLADRLVNIRGIPRGRQGRVEQIYLRSVAIHTLPYKVYVAEKISTPVKGAAKTWSR